MEASVQAACADTLSRERVFFRTVPDEEEEPR
jgi:hypothetical protein